MTNLLMLIPVALILGGIGLVAFLWALKSGQFDDLDGAAHRILFEDDDMDAQHLPKGPGRQDQPKGQA
ncbi:MAG: cbb3-type cytochrome oxidase assembly protein CcoS [Magnetospirillum sp.]|nr:cbb3-type cytochrome oxidase assembly protein CcoS [Magnetospirillum sp.]